MSKAQTAAKKAPAEFAKPSYYPTAQGWKMLIRPIPLKKMTPGGIIIPDAVRDRASTLVNIAQVVSMGDLCFTHPQFAGTQLCKPGDWLLFGQFGGIGHEIKVRVPEGVEDDAEEFGAGGERYVRLRIINDNEVCGVVEEGDARAAVMTYLD